MIASRFWPLVIVGLLGMNAAIVGITVMLARAGAPSVEADYYQRAVRWDERAAQQRASAALGWTAQLTLDIGHANGNSPSFGMLRLRLVDRTGAPVAGAQSRARLFHSAHAGQASLVELLEAPPGVYEARLGSVRPGFWQVELETRRGDDTFLLKQSVEATLKGSAP